MIQPKPGANPAQDTLPDAAAPAHVPQAAVDAATRRRGQDAEQVEAADPAEAPDPVVHPPEPAAATPPEAEAEHRTARIWDGAAGHVLGRPPTTRPPRPTDAPLDGQRLGGRYHVEGLLNAGGMARVWRGRDLLRGDAVAIKVARIAADEDDAWSDESLAEELRIGGSLRHPLVVGARDHGRLLDGRLFVVQDLVPGPDLASLVSREGALGPAATAWVGAQLADALAAIHAVGLVHADVKPSNAVAAVAGEQVQAVRLVDLGLTGLAGQEDDWIAGTPSFMAPELHDGDPTTPASDRYALGVTLYGLWTGRMPFAARDPDALAELHRSAPPPSPAQMPTGPLAPLADRLLQLIHRLMAKAPEARMHDAWSAVEAFTAVATEFERAAPIQLGKMRAVSLASTLRGVGRPARLRASAFVRLEALEGLLAAVQGGAAGPIALVGRRGSGRSAVFTQAARRWTGRSRILRLRRVRNETVARERLQTAIASVHAGVHAADASAGQPGLLLIDGLDEVRPAVRAAVLDEVRALRDVRCVVATTPDHEPPGWSRVAMGPLTADEARTLASAGGQVDDAVAERVVRWSGGHPASIVRSLELLQEHGLLQERDGRWSALHIEALSRPPRPLVDELASQLASHSLHAQSLASLLAVHGVAVGREAARDAFLRWNTPDPLEAPDPDLAPLFAPLFEQGWAGLDAEGLLGSDDGERWALRGAVVAAAAERGLVTRELRGTAHQAWLGARAAAVGEAPDDVRVEGDRELAALVRHALAVGDTTRAARWLERLLDARDKHGRLHALLEALDGKVRALAEAGAVTAARRALLLRAAEAFIDAGALPEAARVFDLAASGSAALGPASGWLRTLDLLFDAAVGGEDGATLAEQAAALAPPRAKLLAWRAGINLAGATTTTGHDAMLTLELAARGADPSARLPEIEAQLEAGLQDSQLPSAEVARVRRALACADVRAGRSLDAALGLDALAAWAARCGARLEHALLRLDAAEAWLAADDAPRAEEHAREADRLLEQLGAHAGRRRALSVLASAFERQEAWADAAAARDRIHPAARRGS